jgi:hypothetical protein
MINHMKRAANDRSELRVHAWMVWDLPCLGDRRDEPTRLLSSLQGPRIHSAEGAKRKLRVNPFQGFVYSVAD